MGVIDESTNICMVGFDRGHYYSIQPNSGPWIITQEVLFMGGDMNTYEKFKCLHGPRVQSINTKPQSDESPAQSNPNGRREEKMEQDSSGHDPSEGTWYEH